MSFFCALFDALLAGFCLKITHFVGKIDLFTLKIDPEKGDAHFMPHTNGDLSNMRISTSYRNPTGAPRNPTGAAGGDSMTGPGPKKADATAKKPNFRMQSKLHIVIWGFKNYRYL